MYELLTAIFLWMINYCIIYVAWNLYVTVRFNAPRLSFVDVMVLSLIIH